MNLNPLTTIQSERKTFEWWLTSVFSQSIRGLKAAINNPNVSEKAKEKDRKKLHDLGEPID